MLFECSPAWQIKAPECRRGVRKVTNFYWFLDLISYILFYFLGLANTPSSPFEKHYLAMFLLSSSPVSTFLPSLSFLPVCNLQPIPVLYEGDLVFRRQNVVTVSKLAFLRFFWFSVFSRGRLAHFQPRKIQFIRI